MRAARRGALGAVLALLLGAGSEARAEVEVAPGHVRYERQSSYPSRQNHALAYDRARGRAVLLVERQQRRGAAPVGETWELVDGSFELVSADGPVPAPGASMAYDEARGVTVLYPGVGADGAFAMWSWDGKSWRDMHIAGLPPGGLVSSLVYVRSIGKLFYMMHTYPQSFLFDGSAWELMTEQVPVDAETSGIAIGYDAARDVVVLWGGLGGDGQLLDTKVREWRNGVGWQTRKVSGGPKARMLAHLAFDERNGRLLLAGGTTPSTPFRDTWALDNDGWHQLDDGGLTLLTWAHTTWHDGLGAMLTLGGDVNRTWRFTYSLFNGQQWAEAPLSRSVPQGRLDAVWAGVGDGTMLLFGGLSDEGGVQVLGDSWVYAGGAFSKLSADGPVGRERPASCSIPGGGVVVHGGFGADGAALDDTWRFDGTWARIASGATPALGGGTLGLEPGGKTALLLGGAGNDGYSSRLFRFDGAGWSEVSALDGVLPPPRQGASAALHPGLGRTYFFGGTDSLGARLDVWSWDGTRFREEAPMPLVSARVSSVFDDALGAVVVRTETATLSFDGARWRVLREEGPEVLGAGAMLAAGGPGGLLHVMHGRKIRGSDGTISTLQFAGQRCTSSEGCAGATCVDGVCCEQAACGRCESCSVAGREGRCAPLGRGERDPDSCEIDQACDGAGACGKAAGVACGDAGECITAHCTEGFCCEASRCEGQCVSCEGQATGLCAVVQGRQVRGKCDGERRCDDAGECRLDEQQPCASHDACASGWCPTGRCAARAAPVCLDEATTQTWGEAPVSCGLARCRDGSCVERCTSSDDCQPGARCTADGACVSSRLGPGVSGCAMGRSAPGAAAALALALALLALRRRRAVLSAAVALLASPAAAAPVAELRLLDPSYFAALDAGVAAKQGGGAYIFGGLEPLTLQPEGQLWRCDGGDIKHVDVTGPSPGPRLAAGMLHDPVSARLLLLGDISGLGDRASWAFDGKAWSKLETRSEPILTSAQQLVFDAKRQRPVLINTSTDGPKLAELFADEWQSVTGSSGGPSRRADAAVGFDAIRGVLVVHGGTDAATFELLSDVWEWDGERWFERTPAAASEGRDPSFAAGVAFDPVEHGLVLCGGAAYKGGATTLLRRCDAWDGTSFKPLPELPEGAFQVPELFFDEARGRVVATLRLDLDAKCRVLAELTGDRWQLLERTTPPPVFDPAVAYNPLSGEVVAHGGRNPWSSEPLPITWVRKGGAWSRLEDAGPPGLSWASMAFSPALSGLVFFGGDYPLSGVPSDNTWLFRDGAWSQLETPTHPAPRSGHRMVTDTARSRVVLFGGTSKIVNFNDLWQFDGSTWTQIFPLTQPLPPRQLPVLAYDERRDRIVLFGGQFGDVLNDTWEFDGTTWERRSPPHSPPPLTGAAGYYDPLAGLTIVVGGLISYQDTAGSRAVWAWDGADWTELVHDHPLGVGTDAGAVYDPSLRGGLMVGGYFGAYRDLGVVEVRVIGQRCADASTCATSACVDEVCCAETTCGPCQSCATPGHEGRCSATPRGAKDGRCEDDARCDGLGACKKLDGAGCEEGGECLSGSCVDQVCCASPSCGVCESCATVGKVGVCAPVIGETDADSCTDGKRCSATGACGLDDGAACGRGDECASGLCVGGVCRREGRLHCDGDHTVYGAARAVDCSPFRCSDDGGCIAQCRSSADCVVGHRCSSQALCVAAAPAAVSGCAAPGSRGATGGLCVLGALALAVVARRRAR